MQATRELRPGDNIVYLFDRERVTPAVLENIRNSILTTMAAEWLQQYTHRFFLTVARNYQPIPGTELHGFDSHDDSVLFLDKNAYVEYLPRLSRVTAGYIWVVMATEDIQDATREALMAPETP
jgi:hypothetical protein